MRYSRAVQKELAKAFGVDRIWSYSRISTFVNCPWEYKVKYIDHVRDAGNVYSFYGTQCHNIIQGFYDGVYTYDQMSTEYTDFVRQWMDDQDHFNFPKSKDGSDKTEKSYIKNLTHYFKNTQVIDTSNGIEIHNEEPVLVQIPKDDNPAAFVLVGYIDSLYKDGDDIYLLDYKTSSKSGFTGKKLIEHSQQLRLYSIGIHQQKGIPYDKINPRFDMMKYVKIRFKQENGKWKETIQERASWVSGIATKLKTKLKKAGLGPLEIQQAIDLAEAHGNLDNLPESVQKQFEVGNCYIDVEINEEIAAETLKNHADTITEIMRREACDPATYPEVFERDLAPFQNSLMFGHMAEALSKETIDYTDDAGKKQVSNVVDLVSLFKPQGADNGKEKPEESGNSLERLGLHVS